jgi:alpha-L-arabinofuranosidase
VTEITVDPVSVEKASALGTATVTIDPAFRIADADRRLFGSFVEHMGRCAYGGVFEPGHRSADAAGLRELDLRGTAVTAALAHTSLAAGAEPAATNTEAHPTRVTPRDLRTPTHNGGRCSVQLPAVSWNLLRFGSRP